MQLRIKKGLDLPITGAPVQEISPKPVATVGVLGRDYLGLRPTMLVAEGDRVRLGQPLFEDKKNPGLRAVAPAAGRIQAIHRGARRRLQSVVIAVDHDAATEGFDVTNAESSAEALERLMVETGLWTALRTRPYSKVPRPGTRPAALFVTAIDTNPLAADPAVVIGERRAAFARGAAALARFSAGKTYICQAPGVDLGVSEGDGLVVAEFAGPHPAGLPGTHMHLLDPVGPGRIAWHLGYQDVIALGHLLETGELDTQRVIALGGPVVERPRLLRTHLGACTEELVEGELPHLEERIISGSVFSGFAARDRARYLGRYHLQVTVLREGRDREAFGWITPGAKKFSVTGALISSLNRAARFGFTTTQNGSPRAMVPIGVYETVMPLDILPTQLLRALLVRDTDTAQALGALELDEEDLALCSFVCPGKYEFGPALRESLDIIEREG